MLISTNANSSRIIGLAAIVTTARNPAAEFFPFQLSSAILDESPIRDVQPFAAITSIVSNPVSNHLCPPKTNSKAPEKLKQLPKKRGFS
jgi:hypothetical protein